MKNNEKQEKKINEEIMKKKETFNEDILKKIIKNYEKKIMKK